MSTANDLQQLYVGYLGRGADQAGLAYWVAEIDGGTMTLEQVRSNFVNEQPEYATIYGGLDREAQVTAIYENLFERAPDADGLEYWVNGGGSTVNADQLIVAFTNAAAVADQAVLDNKVEVAEYYTATLGDADNFDAAAAVTFLAEVGDDASVVTAEAAIDAAVPVEFTLTEVAANAQYAFNTETEIAGSAAELELELAAATAVEAALADGVTQAEIDAAVTALNAANYTTLRATYVSNLATANDTVTAQEEVIADSLLAAFSNEDVVDEAVEAAGAVNTVVGTVDASDIIEADIGQAETTTADVFDGDVAAASAAAFIALTDAQQDGQIALGVLDLQADIDAADAVINKATTGTILDLETGVAADMATTSTQATTLATAMDAAGVAASTENASALAAGAVVVDADALAGYVATSFASANGVITASVDATGDTAGIITTVTDGVVAIDATVAVLDEDTGVYTLTTANADPLSQDVEIEASYLDALVAKAQAELTAEIAVTTAQDALAATIVDVYNGQGSELDAAGYDTYAELVAGGVAVVLETVASGKNVITVDFDGDTESVEAATVALETYNLDLGDLADANTALTDFNDAVAAWEAVDVLVDALAAENVALSTLETAATEASDLITNAVDHATAPGLAINLITIDGANEASTADSDLFMATDVDTAISDFADAGSDSIFVGTDYALFVAGEDAVTADSLGDVSVLEAIVIDDGTDTYVILEEEVFAGNGSTAADLNVIELTGVTGSDVSIDADGFLTVA